MTRTSGDTKLLDACEKPGCPVCRCLEDDGRRHVDAVLHELVTDPETRRALRDSWGFCNWHGWMALAVPGARTGLATVNADVLRTVAARLRRPDDGPRPDRDPRARPGRSSLARRRRGWRARVTELFGPGSPGDGGVTARQSCVACETTVRGEDRYVRLLCRLGDDETVRSAYESSDGLCVRHLRLAIERNPAASALVEETFRKWDRLAAVLDRFVEKHEYRNRVPFTEEEARASERAVEIVSGRPGVWPSDVRR